MKSNLMKVVGRLVAALPGVLESKKRPAYGACPGCGGDRGARRRLKTCVAIAIVTLGALAVSSVAAAAGTYTVNMGDDAGCLNNSWNHLTDSQLFQSYDDFCQSQNSPDDFNAAINMNKTTSLDGQRAQTQFFAPQGTYISVAALSWSFEADYNHNWRVAVDYLGSDGQWHQLIPNGNQDGGCTATTKDCVVNNANWPLGYEPYDIDATALVGMVYCNASWCDNTPETGGPYVAQAWLSIHSAWITLQEDGNPTVTYTGGGLDNPSAYLSGVQTIDYDADDPSGVQDSRFYVDDKLITDNWQLGWLGTCDFTKAVPCADRDGQSFSIDTKTLSDGPHTFSVWAQNTAGNWEQTADQTFNVTNTAPAEAQNASVSGGDGWHTSNSFDLSWTNPSHSAPITEALYEICDESGDNCQDGQQSGNGINTLSGLSVPGPGEYQARVWLEDAAGNVSQAKTPWLQLWYDDTPPGQAAPRNNNGWVNAQQAKSYTEEIDPPNNFTQLASGVAGYAVTTDGSDPGTTVQVPANAQGVAFDTLTNLPEGSTTLKARAISGAGVASSTVGETEIQVDLTPPTVTLTGNSDPNVWSRKPIALGISATDALSGMAPAPMTDPNPADGAYIDYSVDGGPDQKVRGGTALIPVTSDGMHTVDYEAFDLAGNGTGQRSVSFKIDQTPPVAGFEAQDPADATKVSVIASDATSGLADGGVISMREGTSGSWTALPTIHQGAHYYTHLTPASMVPGSYEFEATIPDQAGNIATTDSSADRPGPETITVSACDVGGYPVVCQPSSPRVYTVTDNLTTFLIGPDGEPYDLGSTVGTEVHADIAARVKAARKGVSKTKLVTSLRLAFGKGASVQGSLKTSAGAALPGRELLVLERYSAAGESYQLLQTITTRSGGAFAYKAPAGPGRALVFLFRGDHTYRHSYAQVVLSVPAASTIKASRSSVHNGHSVTFTGRLLGGPFPHPGKQIALEAFYRNKWRTFAVTRADDRGRWAFTYRFQATYGVVVYRFRAMIGQEAAYPYLLGYSRLIKVKVTGPQH